MISVIDSDRGPSTVVIVVPFHRPLCFRARGEATGPRIRERYRGKRRAITSHVVRTKPVGVRGIELWEHARRRSYLVSSATKEWLYDVAFSNGARRPITFGTPFVYRMLLRRVRYTEHSVHRPAARRRNLGEGSFFSPLRPAGGS